MRVIIPVAVFVVQLSAFLISHEAERQYHHGTLFRYGVASSTTRCLWPVIGWLAYVREDVVVLIASVLGAIVGDLFGAWRFIKRRKEREASRGVESD